MPRLVRPYLSPPFRYPEQVPADARRGPTFDDHCAFCPAAPRLIAWKVATKTTGNPEVWPQAGAGVLELQLCGHDATAHEDALAATGWVVVRDRRQALADSERR